jgi:ABC-2 type transport system ATP-binding protein
MQAGVLLELECREPFTALRLLRAQPSLALASLFGRRLHVLVGDAATAAPVICHTLKAAGLVVEHLEQIPLSLEDLFVLLIERAEQQQGAVHA